MSNAPMPDAPDLDRWLAEPSVRVTHRRESRASPERLWEAARGLPLSDTRLLGRLVRWRIPGVPRGASFEELLRSPPFLVLEEEPGGHLVSGLVGRIWTLRRDYPALGSPDEYLDFRRPGNARVLLANWLEPGSRPGLTAICSESRIEVFGVQGRLGLHGVRPIVRRFGGLVGSDGLDAAVRRAERGEGIPFTGG